MRIKKRGRPRKEEVVVRINLSISKDLKKIIESLKKNSGLNCSKEFSKMIKKKYKRISDV